MNKLVIATAIFGMAAGAVFADAHQGNRGKAADMSDAIGSVRDGGGNVGETTRGVSGQNAEPRSNSGWGNQDVGGGSVSEGKPGQSGG